MDYKKTLNLPKTSFSMKANLPSLEPKIKENWYNNKLYTLIRKKSQGKPSYILHDGPPYANGEIHLGHALNKILKDFVVKFKTMNGFDSAYIPGWDCHGMPIEHQLFKELGISKDKISQLEFRKKAHQYAMKFVNIQKEDFKRLGVLGDWDNPYLTLDPKYEAAVIRSFGQLVKKGFIGKGLKPVNWCFKCETALAEAEVEYEDHSSSSIYVKFNLLDTKQLPLANLKLPVHLVIWTTTPWTLLANVAVALHPQLEYDLVKSDQEILIIAKALVKSVTEHIGLKNYKVLGTIKGKDLEGLDSQHPFINRRAKVVLGEHVSHQEGTGCVHTAPGHGQEDYLIGLKYKLPVIMPVKPNGTFDETVQEFAGKNVHESNQEIINKLKKEGKLLLAGEVRHSYPHCWRCKNPIIFRATQQWFLDVDHNNLRKEVIESISRISWYPPSGKERMEGMVKLRPDWCLSRQRYWGIPIPAFYCKKCKALLLKPEIIDHVAGIVEKEGSNAWFNKSAQELLPPKTKCSKCKEEDFEQEKDILDVWFESGVSHQAVLKSNSQLKFPADLYLEGSDQHRGWFQVALITSIGIEKQPSFKEVLTHGFTVDGEGRKMSKSLGNVIAPQEIIKDFGADILRLWVASCDYSDDVRLSPEILSRLIEAYRKIRNTVRFLLGNLYDFNPEEKVAYKDLGEIDKWALDKLARLIKEVSEKYEKFEFYKAFHLIYQFCVIEMSSIYLDILKDRLYTFAAAGKERRSAQTVLYETLSVLTKIIAPILSFSAEEIWLVIPKVKAEQDYKSVHLSTWPKVVNDWCNKELGQRWERLFKEIRPVVLKALEENRNKGLIGNSLEAKVNLLIKDKKLLEFLKSFKDDLAGVFISSEVTLAFLPELPSDSTVSPGLAHLGIKIEKAAGKKCARCWNYSLSVGEDKEHSELCVRCLRAIR